MQNTYIHSECTHGIYIVSQHIMPEGLIYSSITSYVLYIYTAIPVYQQLLKLVSHILDMHDNIITDYQYKLKMYSNSSHIKIGWKIACDVCTDYYYYVCSCLVIHWRGASTETETQLCPT